MAITDRIESMYNHTGEAYAMVEEKGGLIDTELPQNLENLSQAISTIDTHTEELEEMRSVMQKPTLNVFSNVMSETAYTEFKNALKDYSSAFYKYMEYNSSEVSGTDSVQLENALSTNALSVSIKGNNVQEQPSGKNLFQFGDRNGVKTDSGNGLNIEYLTENKVRITGTPTTTSLGINAYKPTTYMTDGTQYTLSADLNKAIENLSISFYGIDKGGATISSFSLTSANSYKATRIVNYSNLSYTVFALRNLNTEVEYDFILDMQVEEGSVKTEHEIFTGGIPSPNPDYPQEIKTLTEGKIKVYQNLLNTDDWSVGGWITGGTPSSAKDIIRFNTPIDVTEGDILHLSKPLAYCYLGEKEIANRETTIRIPSGKTKMYFRIFVADAPTFNPKDYVIYKEPNEPTEIELPLEVPLGKNLLNMNKLTADDFLSSTKGGLNSIINLKENTNEKIILDATGDNQCSVFTKIRSLKPNTTYTISLNIEGYNSENTLITSILNTWCDAYENLEKDDVTYNEKYNIRYHRVSGTKLKDKYTNNSITFTTKNGGDVYVDFKIWGVRITKVILSKIQLEEGATATEYEQYSQYELTSNDTLQIGYDGNTHIEKKWGEFVLTGDEGFTLSSTSTHRGFLKSKFLNVGVPFKMCTHFIVETTYTAWTGENKIGISSTGNLWIQTEKFASADDFNAFLKQQYNAGTPVTIYYELATPEIVELENTQIPLLPDVNNITIESNVEPIETKVKFALDIFSETQTTSEVVENE